MDEFISFAFGMVVGGVVFVAGVGGCVNDCDRRAAINAGVAKYEVNEQSGETKFVFIKKPACDTPPTPVLPRQQEGK